MLNFVSGLKDKLIATLPCRCLFLCTSYNGNKSRCETNFKIYVERLRNTKLWLIASVWNSVSCLNISIIDSVWRMLCLCLVSIAVIKTITKINLRSKYFIFPYSCSPPVREVMAVTHDQNLEAEVEPIEECCWLGWSPWLSQTAISYDPVVTPPTWPSSDTTRSELWPHDSVANPENSAQTCLQINEME